MVRASIQSVRLALGILAVAALAGCGTNPVPNKGTPTTFLRPPGIYVTNSDNAVTIFALDASGNVAPTRRIAGNYTGLSLPIGIAMDSQNNLYVANRTGSVVTVYKSDADGNTAPIRRLTDPDMKSPSALAIGSGGDIFVATCPNCGSAAGGQTAVFHFANGATASDYRIGGATNNNTGFTVPAGVLLPADSSNPSLSPNIIVGNAFGGNVATFAPGTVGDQLPIRTFSPRAGANLQSLAFANASLFLAVPGAVIDIYPATAAPNAQPSATIPSSPTFPINYPGGITVDASVTPPVIYQVDYFGNAVFVLKTAGIAPNLTLDSVTTIKGAATQLSNPLDVLVVKD